MQKFSPFLILLVATGCVWRDPVKGGYVAANPETVWEAPQLAATPDPIIPISNDHPLSVAEMIDIALRYNPATTTSWALAREAAFNWQASQSTLYPTVDYTGQFAHVDQSPNFGGFSSVSSANIANTNPIDNTNPVNNVNPVTPINPVSPINPVTPINPSNPISPVIPLMGASDEAKASATKPSAKEAAPSSKGAAPTPPTPATPSSLTSLNHFNRYTSIVSLQYLVLDFGGRFGTIDSFLQALFAANWTHNRTLQDVTIQVLDAYYDFINAKELLQARLDDLKDSKANLDAADEQLRSGVSTKIDFLQAKSNYVNVQLSVEQLKGQVEVNHGRLAASLGFPANTRFRVEDLPEKLPLDQVTQSVEEFLETAKIQRPDLAAFYANYQQEEANLRVVRSDALPTLTFDSNYVHNSFLGHSKLNGHQYETSLVLSVPIFTGFFHVNQIRAAKERVLASYSQLQQKQQSVSLEVVTNYYAYKTAVETLKYSREYLKFAEESYQATSEGYRSGIQTFVDVLVAQAVLANARAQHVTARTTWVTSLANLSYSTGVL